MLLGGSEVERAIADKQADGECVMPQVNGDVREKLQLFVDHVQGSLGEAAEFDTYVVNRDRYTKELAELKKQIEDARADRLDALNSNRFALDRIKREIERSKGELAVVQADLERHQLAFTKLVAELRDLKRQNGMI